MTIFRCKELVFLGAAGALASCGNNGKVAVDPTTSTLKQIIESGIRNPRLSELLNRRLDLLNSEPSRLERQLRTNATEVVMTPNGCGTWAIVGRKRNDLLGRDDTVRARISLCPNGRARLRTTTVTFGAA